MRVGSREGTYDHKILPLPILGGESFADSVGTFVSFGVPKKRH